LPTISFVLQAALWASLKGL